jgi:hypothetical protein
MDAAAVSSAWSPTCALLSQSFARDEIPGELRLTAAMSHQHNHTLSIFTPLLHSADLLDNEFVLDKSFLVGGFQQNRIKRHLTRARMTP